MTKKMMKTSVLKTDPAAVMKLPYARRLTPDPDGGYVATIQEFPGCVAEGDTADEALNNLEAAAESWLAARIGQGQPVPEPVALHGYSGKIALRIPRGVHKQVAELAAAEGTSVNQMILSAVASYVGAHGVLDICRHVAIRMQQENIFRQLPVKEALSLKTANVFRLPADARPYGPVSNMKVVVGGY
ncbi:type II toxin-antitoxin system HicB family antitoxin [Luteimonas sp. 50]|uniref:Type II toxin-antitoxin system HicB family antitoxin n=1 Tax=Cognatiluteimonas sedimenti TaxID=2927791 RepID=A0ABT0A4N1_9GAMM|nr:type II toxin-antitoxin system HicB family antitoxin [Lysobacter sedimenti]MCJ0825943.1 type II toxin-antitoxin system HicB family antitoxin [Lysobacter sedimenti]